MARRRQSRARFVLLLLVLTAGTIITLSYRGEATGIVGRAKHTLRDAFSPVGSAFVHGFRPVADFFVGAFRYHSEKTTNARLRKEIGDLQRQRLETADQRRQLAQLLALENLPFAQSIPKVAAEVVDTTSSNFQLTVTLDRGTGAGVADGMTVVGGQGLLGRVVEASRSTSTVLLLTDPSSQIGVRTPSGVVGVASGRGPNQALRVDFIPPSTPLHKGDVLVTSGLQGALFPDGIPVGQVSSVVQHPDALQEDVNIKPVVPLDQVQYVDVLKWTPGG